MAKGRLRQADAFFAWPRIVVACFERWPVSTPAHAPTTPTASSRPNKISLEAAIRIWRKAAWQDDDFLSEIKLGDIYGDERGDNKFYDPVEAYVWYYLASVSTRIDDHIGDPYARRVISNDFHRALANSRS